MNKRQMLASGLIMLGMVIATWLFALPAWLAALLSAMLMLPLPWRSLRHHREILQACESSTHAALNNTTQPVLLLDAQARTLIANPAFLALAQLKASASERPDDTLSALPEAWQEFVARLHQRTLEKGSGSAEALLPQTGKMAMLRAHGLSLTAPDGSARIVLLWENLSGNNANMDQLLEREQTLLARSQTFVQSLMDVIPQSVYIKHIEGNQSHYTQVNSAFCALHNRSRKELIGTTTFDLFRDPAYASMINQEDLRVLDGMSVFREEESIDPQTGKARFTIVSKQTCEDAEGRTVIVGSNFDITPWRMAERNLKQALQREVARREQAQSFIQRLIDVIPHPVHVKDAHCRYLMVNDAFVRERGRSREELLGKNPLEVAKLLEGVPRAAQETELQRASLSLQEDYEVLAGDILVKEEHNLHSVTGEERFRTVYKGGCLDGEGRPVIVTAFFDVTKWRLAERHLADALARETALLGRTQTFTQRLIDLLPEEFYVKDADSRYVRVNQAFLRRRNLPPDFPAVGCSMEDLASAMCHANPLYQRQPELLAGAIVEHHERARKSREEDLAVLAGRNLFKEEHQILSQTGEERVLLVAKTTCEDPEGRPVIVCANLDITALRLAERELQDLKNQHPD